MTESEVAAVPGPPASTTNDSEGKTMKAITKSRKRCPQCRTRMLRLEGKLQCPTMSCPASPVLATLAEIRRLHPPPSVRAGYRPADHSLPPSNPTPGWYGDRTAKAADARTPETRDGKDKREEPLRGGVVDGMWVDFPEGL